MSVATQPVRERDGGFALLVLLIVIGAGATGILLAVNHFVPPLSDISQRVAADLTVVQRAAAEAFGRNGAFPADMNAVAASVGQPATGDWRRDPWDPARDLAYTVTGTGLQIATRGPDRTSGTADDVSFTVLQEPWVRLRQRTRLRLLRASYLAELVRGLAVAGATSPTTAQLRAALRDAAAAQREWRTATATQRATLTTRLVAAAAVVAGAKTAASWIEPAAVTGAGGLMQRIRTSDTLAVDGLGRALQLHTTLGVIAVGSDGTGGTDDDM